MKKDVNNLMPGEILVKTDGDSLLVHTSSSCDTALYIEEVALELLRLSNAENQKFLSYLIGMVCIEAAEISRKRRLT